MKPDKTKGLSGVLTAAVRHLSTVFPGDKKALKTLLLPCLLGHLLSPLAFCWSSVPHAAIARVAQNRLSAAAQLEMRYILGEHAGLDQIANCADAILGNSVVCADILPLDKDSRSRYWHFIDIPLNSFSQTPWTLAQFCDNNCITSKIYAELAVLKDPEASRTDKQTALMFVVHFVGDLHQPLHAAAEHKSNGSNDFGGVKKPVTYVNITSTGTTLHRLWDNMVMSPEEAKALDLEDLTRSLEQDIAQKDVRSWTSGDNVIEAALESFRIAKKVVYPSYYDNPLHVYDLQDSQRMRPVIRTRLEKAAVRLAFLLEQALNPAQTN